MTLLHKAFAIGIALVVLGAALAGCGPTPPTQTAHNAPHADHAAPPDTGVASVSAGYRGDPVAVRRVYDFNLPSTENRITRFSDLNGRWRVVFFGYLHCPDFCPLTLVDFKLTNEQLGADADKVRFVYITIDALRDSQEDLRAYLDNFDPTFIGFVGDDATLIRMQPDYGYYYSRRLADDPAALMTVEHSTRSYLIDPKGLIRASFAYHTDPQVMADALRWYIANDHKGY